MQSRAGEVAAIRGAIAAHFPDSPEIVPPGTLDAGDVCEGGNRVFIGLSHRTNHEGARQLGDWLGSFGVESITVDMRDTPGILHLKSGVVAIDARTLVAIDALADHPCFAEYEGLRVKTGDEYSANCVRVNDVVFVASGYPTTHNMLRRRGYELEIMDMSEFEKMDGGLSCLSLRF